ncbi:hypothetical protein V1503_20865 [Bacillus sp. SCS-151]|uniref:hypothetical protein n=1 Tax=Nanhaiella sioensis TaxID=3115293 RepID=UPI00397B3EEF
MSKIKDLLTYEDFFMKKIFSNKEHYWEVLQILPNFIQTILSKKNATINGEVEDKNSVNNKNIFVGKDSFIERGAYVKGPAIIGENVKIYHGAYIRDNVIIGDNCIIGSCSEIKHSIILNGSSAPHYNFVGNSILGQNVNLGGGVHLSNFKNVPFGGKIKVKTIDNKTISTNLNYLGSIVGDNSKIGVNCVLNPGSVIGKNVLTYPNLTIRGYIENNSLVKNINQIEIKRLL